MESSIRPVDLTGRSPAALEDGVAHVPKRQKIEVNEDTDDEETDGDEPEDKELQQLIVENKMLNNEALGLLKLLDNVRGKKIELVNKQIVERAELINRMRERIAKRVELGKLFSAVQTSK